MARKMGRIGKAMVRAYENQRYSAAKRGIAWKFTFDTWCDWWIEDDRIARRGRGKGRLCMARRGDVGPYSYDNCYPATLRENIFEHVPQAKRAAGARRAHAARREAGVPSHLANRQAHPCGRSVQCPVGVFASAALAAEACGWPAWKAQRWARLGEAYGGEGLDGWRYLPAEPKLRAVKVVSAPRRRIVTPHGEFESTTAAAWFYDRTPQRIGQLCRAGKGGWSYAVG